MIQQLQYLEEYLSNNNLQHTLQSLRSEILGLYPQAPSQQFISTVENGGQKKSNTQFSSRVQEKKSGLRKKQQLVVEGLLGKIAYSSKLLQDPNLNDKISKMMDNRIFQKTVSSMFPESSRKDPPEEKSYDFKDELDFAEMPNQNESINYPPPNNMISHIDMEQESSSILSQPSLVLQELNRHETTVDEYKDDNDLGYEEYQFTENELLSGCSKLTKKYGYPDKAVKKNSKQQINIKKNQKKKDGSKFPNGIMFPDSSDSLYPLQYSGVIYDVLKLKVVFDREKTGYEETKEINIKEGEILAGRYRVESVLGSGVFAKVLKVTDLMKGELTCLKMISNNKDFFDQALDEIKILRYISSNCDPDEEHLLKFKNVFYHREHLFIQTELLKDNLFIAYRKNGSLFSIPVIREIARQILQALNTLHKLQIIHADLKPENILIKSINPIEVKVIDLGNSCFFHDHLGEYVQSRSYRAPEVVLGVGYDEKIDIWSLGCILAELWTKNVLFYNVHVPGMLARIQSIIGPWPEWMLDNGQGVENLFSKENLIYYEEEAKFHILIPKKTTLKDRVRTEDEEFLSFIQATLRIDPNFRLSAEEALMHPFLNHQ